MESKPRWPVGSLERTLKSLGVSSLKEALAKQLKPKVDEPAQTTDKDESEREKAEVMKKAIEDITEALDGFNIEDLDMRDRERLGLMPLRDEIEILSWKKAWLDTLVKARW